MKNKFKVTFERSGHSYSEMMQITWNDVGLGDTVYIDHYQGGKFPLANPKISGPFLVVHGNGCGRCLQTKSGNVFMHYPNNLLSWRASPDVDGSGIAH